MKSIIAIDGLDCAGFADYTDAFAVLVALQKDGVKATMHCKHKPADTCIGCWYDNRRIVESGC